MKIAMRRHHDIGGLNAGKVDRKEHDYLLWEKRVDAIVRLLSSDKCQILKIDEVRRGIEDLGPNAYDEYNYYGRWISSITKILIEKGIINIEELGRYMEDITSKMEATD